MLHSLVLLAATALSASPPAAPAKTAATPAPASAAAQPAEPAVHPKVMLHTSMGDITIELFPEKAPKTVDNFLKYTNDKFYNGTVFHRVIDNFMVQGGGFAADLKPKATRPPIPNEAKNGLSNLNGTVAMARTSDPNSATAQFFVNVADNTFLDFVSAERGETYGYCVFGKVVSGMDVVDKIKKVETGAQPPFSKDVPKTPVVIQTAEVMK